MMRVELLVQVCINGRPIWVKARSIKPENTVLMTDKEYDRITAATERELNIQAGLFKKKEDESKKEPVEK